VDREQLLKLIEQLKSLCRLPAGDRDVFERICALIRSIQEDAPAPSIAALALDVRFKSEDIHVRPYLMPEAVLRQMLEDKLLLLEATARISPALVERRGAGNNLGRRASDRAAAAAALPVTAAAIPAAAAALPAAI
jgi:hypothetical protein